jgi:hypothetical protein
LAATSDIGFTGAGLFFLSVADFTGAGLASGVIFFEVAVFETAGFDDAFTAGFATAFTAALASSLGAVVEVFSAADPALAVLPPAVLVLTGTGAFLPVSLEAAVLVADLVTVAFIISSFNELPDMARFRWALRIPGALAAASINFNPVERTYGTGLRQLCNTPSLLKNL